MEPWQLYRTIFGEGGLNIDDCITTISNVVPHNSTCNVLVFFINKCLVCLVCCLVEKTRCIHSHFNSLTRIKESILNQLVKEICLNSKYIYIILKCLLRNVWHCSMFAQYFCIITKFIQISGYESLVFHQE